MPGNAKNKEVLEGSQEVGRKRLIKQEGEGAEGGPCGSSDTAKN